MDPKRAYPAEPPPAADKRAKSKAPALAPITDDKRFADATAIFRALEAGLQQIECERDALVIETYLGNSRWKKDSRNASMRERLKGLRAVQPAAAVPLSSGDLPPAVVAGLALVREGIRPSRRDHKAEIARLDEDLAVVREAILAQQIVVDAIRDELVGAQARQDKKTHNNLVLAHYRALQTAAAAADALVEFRRLRIDAGFVPWRSDLLPEPGSRPALFLGSESDWNSAISHVRRSLEEAKIL